MQTAFVRRSIPLAAMALALTMSASAAASRRPQGQPRVNPDAQLAAEFLKLVDAYAELHRKAEGTLPALPKEPTAAQLDTHERALARLIVQSRGGARQGDIFTREIRAYFRRQIGRVVAGADGQQIRDTIMEENPGAIRLRINGRYPDTLPMTTMPPQILASLPKLPKELEYRFIGSRLVLLDTHTQLIVDYIDDSIPR